MLNGSLKGWWSFFFLGTFVANVAACTLSGALSAALGRARATHLGDREWLQGGSWYWLYICLHAAMTGFAGSLSTVSTLVVEVLKITPAKNQTKVHTATYIGITWGSCFVMTMTVYAWSQ